MHKPWTQTIVGGRSGGGVDAEWRESMGGRGASVIHSTIKIIKKKKKKLSSLF